MHRYVAPVAIGAAVALGTAGAFYARLAYAADSRFDQAIDNCTKALALLEAARNDGAKDPKDFHGHRGKAMDDLKDAIKQIGKAKAYDDKTPGAASGGGN
jgi:hypothetical protein